MSLRSISSFRVFVRDSIPFTCARETASVSAPDVAVEPALVPRAALRWLSGSFAELSQDLCEDAVDDEGQFWWAPHGDQDGEAHSKGCGLSRKEA